MPVSYIPSQLEAPARASLTLRASPSRLLLKDLKLAFSLVRWLPYIILPLRSDSGPPHLSNIQDVALHGTIFILTVSSAGLAARFAFVMPGSTLMVFTVACWASLMGLCFPLNYGNRVLKSAVNLDGYPEHLRERWIFVNGICAGTRLMQENLDMISTIFKRPVIGVHNRTYGIIFDLIECLVQRDFSYMTSDIRITYNNIKETLLDEEVDRVVLIAHSQGGIIIGAALDALYADVPASAWEKLEVYTFG